MLLSAVVVVVVVVSSSSSSSSCCCYCCAAVVTDTTTTTEHHTILNVSMQNPGFDLNVPCIPDDIAIIQLAEPVNLTNPYVGVIGLPQPNENFVGNPNCWIMGWGLTCKLSFQSFNTRTQTHTYIK